METIAYLHLALTHEEPTDITQNLTLENLKLLEWLKQQKLATHTRIYLLSLVVSLSILGIAGEALAQRVLRQGSRGSDVELVQERLQELGYLYQSPDGVFGPATRNALIRFQQAYELTPDGVVGSETEAALFDQVGQRPYNTFNTPPLPTLYPPSVSSYEERSVPSRSGRLTDITLLQRGDSGPEVRRLQERLRREGYNPGAIDGIFGRDTERAVLRFQRANGLEADGVAGRETLTALGIGSGSPRNSYVVVVPIRGDDTLSEVRRYISSATRRNSKRGEYVNARAFNNRNEAESLSYQLRSRGFDARVVYRP
ncbi:MAG: peptidoglycan-binding protein [Symplocastrum torsivum CPER-KK1]|jgi:peptidoglycan hydrolase-like protein with peptidoglycan-binding domain|uniref:Peptidoglycan-binding protein n=1 Tax=Symplocastrum torsivum CPER-KK1 TaxID=450513 RepID=A0A951PN43_9CYAN|nr:peptidoglycan-binding protein [Symplocastrum torsivum CPER-KK1]